MSQDHTELINCRDYISYFVHTFICRLKLLTDSDAQLYVYVRTHKADML